jgi:hypothetical protein
VHQIFPRYRSQYLFGALLLEGVRKCRKMVQLTCDLLSAFAQNTLDFINLDLWLISEIDRDAPNSAVGSAQHPLADRCAPLAQEIYSTNS